MFERRYADEPVTRDVHLLESIRYVALNPVRAGMVDRPQDWEWSTYAQLVGLRPAWPHFDSEDALALFGSVEAVRGYVEEVPGTPVPGTETS